MFPKIKGTPKNHGLYMETPIKVDDLGGKPTIFGNTHHWDPFFRQAVTKLEAGWEFFFSNLSSPSPTPIFLTLEVGPGTATCGVVEVVIFVKYKFLWSFPIENRGFSSQSC